MEIMKQKITTDQLNELSEKGKERLREWWGRDKQKYGDLFIYNGNGEGLIGGVDEEGDPYRGLLDLDAMPLISIGQMIEFLDEHGKFINIWRGLREDWLIVINDDTHIAKPELSDALWEATKECLEK